MRSELGRYNRGTFAEISFFLEQVEETGKFYYLQSGPRGERRLELQSAVNQPFYRQAVEMAQSLIEKAEKHSTAH